MLTASKEAKKYSPMDEKDLQETPEQKEAEDKALEEVQEEALKEKLADEYGVDPEEEPELFEKILEREKSHRELLSTAIKQKRTWREKAQKGTSKETPPGTPPKEDDKSKKSLTEEDVDRRVEERLAERDLQSLNLPDDIKAEVKDLAKLKGISVIEAKELPYIKNRILEAEKAKKVEEATPKRNNKGKYAPADPSQPLNPDDYDLSTPEGREAWNNDKAARRKYQAEHNA
jgi:hypothetical protein